MENQEVNNPQGEDLSNWSFATPEEVVASQQPEPEVQEAAVEQPEQPIQEQSTPEVQEVSTEAPVEQVDNTVNNQDIQYSEQDVEGAVFRYLSEKLGRDVNSIDDLNRIEQQEKELDARVEAIAKFVDETGRDPGDWFRYQSLNASEMDDMTAIQVQMVSDYPNLSQEEINTLMGSKYKLDPNLHTEEEVKLSQLQMKIDAQNARQTIDKLRESYRAPEVRDSESSDSPIDDQWIANMRSELNSLEAIEFDLGNGKSFNFGLNEQYKGQLAEKNTRLDEFFDPYVREDGSWDYDTLNIHRSVIDNMEQIVQSIYKQGIADGQKGIVNQAANASTQTPNQANATKEDSLSAQLREALGGNSTWSF